MCPFNQTPPALFSASVGRGKLKKRSINLFQTKGDKGDPLLHETNCTKRNCYPLRAWILLPTTHEMSQH